MPKVEVYYSQMCELCHKAMDYFDEQGVAYTSYEVFWRDGQWADDENSRAMLSRCGDVDYVPQVFIDDKHIEGWRTLSRLIETGEIAQLLEKTH